ncbi:GNAT family N-acetyltransferase, partial [Priestia megaterium]
VDPELGYLFLRSRWGKGYASEAAKACLDYGLHTLKFQKITSLIDPDNYPSIKVAERIGMKKEKQVNKWDKSLFFYSIYNEK